LKKSQKITLTCEIHLLFILIMQTIHYDLRILEPYWFEFLFFAL